MDDETSNVDYKKINWGCLHSCLTTNPDDHGAYGFLDGSIDYALASLSGEEINSSNLEWGLRFPDDEKSAINQYDLGDKIVDCLNSDDFFSSEEVIVELKLIRTQLKYYVANKSSGKSVKVNDFIGLLFY